MSDITVVALITGLITPIAALAGVGLTGWQQAKHQEKEVAANLARDAVAHEREIESQRAQRLRAVRGPQADAIRAWNREVLITNINIAYNLTAAEVQGMPVEAAAWAANAQRLIAKANAAGETASVDRVLAEVSDLAIIQQMRVLANFELAELRPVNTAIGAFLAVNPAPWNPEQLRNLSDLQVRLRGVQDRLDALLADTNKLLERYEAPI